MKIFIDPGHGGIDPGAVGAGGTHEADITLSLAILLRDKLLAAGADVWFSRITPGENPSLSERGKMAAVWGADLFISEHCNGAGDPSAYGVECYYSVDLPETKGLAANLSAAVAGVLGTKNRGAKVNESKNYPGEDYYTVIDTAQDGGVPVVLLIENGFITNPSEEKLLKDPETLERIAQAQAEVIIKYFPDRLTMTTGTPILGQPQATLAQAEAWAEARGATAEFIGLAATYWRLAPATGVRPDVAFCQSAKETAFGKFTGQVKADFHNPAGIKTYNAQPTGDPPNAHHRFADWDAGVQAHLDHLALYAGAPGYPKLGTPDPRHFPYLKGTAQTVEALGGRWAPGLDYGRSIVKDYLAGLLATPEPSQQPEPSAEIIELKAKVQALESEKAQLLAKITDLQGIISQVAEAIKKAAI